MRPNFDECRRRLDGADEDFKTLVAEMSATFKGKTDLVKMRPVGHKTRQNVVVAEVTELTPIPPHWDRRIAHVLYDARSALDHLVHELYVARNKKRPPKSVAGVLQFPICDSKGAWTNATADTPKHVSWLHGIHPDAIKIIHRHQPYRSRKTALKRLRRFNDLDKHRRPNVVLFTVSHATIYADPLAACAVLGVETAPGMNRALKVGAELFYVHIRPIGPVGQPCVGVGFRGQIFPAFTRGIPIEDLMAKTILEVRSIVEACAKVA